jgi:hypothetical protein
MAEILGNQTSDEYIYPPQKKTINSFDKDVVSDCLSPYGPVSNINCPKDNPYCTCADLIIRPESIEPSDQELVNLKNATSECAAIYDVLGTDWFGIDYDNPHSSYNCADCVPVNDTENPEDEFGPVEKSPEDWKNYFQVSSSNTTDSTGETTSQTTKQYYFNYDKRKIFGETPFPASSSEVSDLAVECNSPLIGQYFKYYKEYSKTSATFWNTPPKTPLLRKAQTSLMMAQRIKILVHGNLLINPGKIVTVDYPNFGGRWMVYKVERIITAQKHSMYLYLMRDGVS